VRILVSRTEGGKFEVVSLPSSRKVMLKRFKRGDFSAIGKFSGILFGKGCRIFNNSPVQARVYSECKEYSFTGIKPAQNFPFFFSTGERGLFQIKASRTWQANSRRNMRRKKKFGGKQ
jgi:hypothetical protein